MKLWQLQKKSVYTLVLRGKSKDLVFYNCKRTILKAQLIWLMPYFQQVPMIEVLIFYLVKLLTKTTVMPQNTILVIISLYTKAFPTLSFNRSTISRRDFIHLNNFVYELKRI